MNRNRVRFSQRHAAEHDPWPVVEDVDVLVALAIALRLEGRDRVAKVLLELGFGPESEMPDVGMQTVRPDDEIETARRRELELDAHLIGLLTERDNLISEHDLAPTRRPVEQEPGKTAARDRDEASACKGAEPVHAKASKALALVADDLQLSNVVAGAFNPVFKSHPLGDVVAQAPEIDHVAAIP